MPVEFIGSVVPAHPRPSFVPDPKEAQGARHDPEHLIRAAALDDEAGFDKLLVGYRSSAPDGVLVANEVLTTTSRLGVVIAHVPGLMAPTLAARQYATLAAFHPGRVAMHAVTDARAAGDLRDGDVCVPTAQSPMGAEFLEVVRMAWGARQPFDYSGKFYRVAGAVSATLPRDGCLPIYFSGEATADVRVGAAFADVYLLPHAPLPSIAGQIARVRAVAARYGRSPRFGVSLRLLASPTDRIARDRLGSPRTGTGTTQPGEPFSWISSANIGGAESRSIALAGTYDEVARVLLDYVSFGITTLVIGHDPETEAADCAEVIARVRDRASGLRVVSKARCAGARSAPGLSAVAMPPGRESACRPSAAACLMPGWPA